MGVLRWLVRVILIVVPLVTCAARIRSHLVVAPDAIAQEVNQCLRLVNVAASRRLTPAMSARPRLAARTRAA